MRKKYLSKLRALSLLIVVAVGLDARPAGAFAASAFDEAPSVTVELTDCPDAGGVVRGTARIATGEAATEIEIAGYVTDAAELSHFDLAGVTVETLSGGGRAKRIAFRVARSDLGATEDATTDDLGRRGGTEFVEPTGADAKMAAALKEAAARALAAAFPPIVERLRAARAAWRGGACVEVNLAAAKTKLMPGEQIAVTAESRQTRDRTPFAAPLRVTAANAGATPDEQNGAPRAVFRLTAPPRGANASIEVESVSKRGVGRGRLEFLQDATVGRRPNGPGRPKPPIVDPKKPSRCNYGSDWKGTITVETRGRRDHGNQRPGGRLVEAVAYTETDYTITYRLSGERDTSGEFANAFYADARVSYATKNVRNLVYAPAYCGTTRVPQSRQEFRQKSDATGTGRVTVFVSAYDRDSSFQLFAPNAVGTTLTEQLYDSSCPREDAANSFARPGEPFEWQFEGLLLEFVNESAGKGELIGAKAIENGDGTTTTVEWNLTSDCR